MVPQYSTFELKPLTSGSIENSDASGFDSVSVRENRQFPAVHPGYELDPAQYIYMHQPYPSADYSTDYSGAQFLDAGYEWAPEEDQV
jgi:hypothetical protein